jgi:hypothetical protein
VIQDQTLTKAAALAELVAKRRQETHPDFRHLHEFDEGRWDFEYVVPWTKSACSLHARLMVIGQDWASENFLKNPKYNTPDRVAGRQQIGQDEYLPTNKRLKTLLRRHFSLEFSQTYATDVLVFIKPGKMTGNVLMKDLQYCAETYTLPQLRIIQPDMAICLGAKTFKSLRRALKLPDLKLSEATVPSGHTVYDRTEIYGVSHTGGLGHANAGGSEKVDQIWASLAARFQKLRDRGPVGVTY